MTPQEAIQFLESLPDDMPPIQLSSGEQIINMKKFKEIHIARLNNPIKEGLLFESTLNRVITLKTIFK